jgi:hypothetical protein
MADTIHGILCIIVQLYVNSEIDGVIPPKLFHDIASFGECVPLPAQIVLDTHFHRPRILRKIFNSLKLQDGMGRLKSLLKQVDNKTRMDQCAHALDDCAKMFAVSMAGFCLQTAHAWL